MSLNDQALAGAAGVLKKEAVVPASMCRRFSVQDRVISQFAGMQKLALQMKVGSADSMGMNQNLPEQFLIAVTDTQVHALEAKDKRGRLKVGKPCVTWDRQALEPVLAPPLPPEVPGFLDTPADSQVVVVHPPPDLRRASSIRKKLAGPKGAPVHLLFGVDPVSQQVVDLLVADGQASGGHAPASSFPGASFLGSPTVGSGSDRDRLDNLARLGDLHASGVLTDAEFDAQKAAILRG